MLFEQLDRIKKLVFQINEIEKKLSGRGVLPLSEQRKLHDQMRVLKQEMNTLEKRTRR